MLTEYDASLVEACHQTCYSQAQQGKAMLWSERNPKLHPENMTQAQCRAGGFLPKRNSDIRLLLSLNSAASQSFVYTSAEVTESLGKMRRVCDVSRSKGTVLLTLHWKGESLHHLESQHPGIGC